MVRTFRTRQREWLVSQGTRKGHWIIPYDDTVLTKNNEACEDFIGRPVSDGNFKVVKVDRSNFKGFKGTNVNPNNPTVDKLVYESYPMGYQMNWIAPHFQTDAPGDSGLGAKILSMTNPSRPAIVPLTLVQDVFDIPRMLRDVGKLIRTPKRLLSPREQANQYLGAKFGWLPLIHDVQTLMHFADYVQARKGEIDRLFSEQGLKRRVHLGEGHASGSRVDIANSDLGMSPLLTIRVSQDTQETVRGTARWKPVGFPPNYNPSDADKIRAAIQVCSGFTTEGLIKGAWDLLPWTWIVDWFGNVGDWLTQNSSTIPAAPVSCCIIREQITIQKHQVIDKPKWLIDNGGVGIFSTKSRTIAAGTLAASLPTLDANRLSILSALFVQRFKKR